MTLSQRLAAASAALVVVLLSAGCVAHPASTESPTTAATAPIDADCLVGTWNLDLGNFQQQVQDYTEAHGVTWDGPLVVSAGVHTVVFDPTTITVYTSLQWAAARDGISLNMKTESAGSGAWALHDDTLAVTGWTPLAESTDEWVAQGYPPVAIDATAPGITVEMCSSATLTLQQGGIDSVYTR